MLRRSLRTFGSLLSEQATLAQRGARNGGSLLRRPLSSFHGAAERTTVVSRTTLSKGRLPFSFRATPRRTFHSSQARRSQNAAAESQSLSARLKKLSREYGWTAIGVYLALSALDFPFCFLFVRAMGTEKIAAAEHAVVSYVKSAVPESVRDTWRSIRPKPKEAAEENDGATGAAGQSVQEIAEPNKKEASLATQLALAYAIHKSVLIFVRVPLTAAVTPKVVKVLRSWGWKIGKSPTK